MERPYDDLVGSAVWAVVSDAIDELTENQDIALTTDRYYVIGFLIRALAEARLISI